MGAQYLLAHPIGQHRHDCPQPLVMGRLEQPGYLALKPAAWLNRAQGLDCANEGLALGYDAVGDSALVSGYSDADSLA